MSLPRTIPEPLSYVGFFSPPILFVSFLLGQLIVEVPCAVLAVGPHVSYRLFLVQLELSNY